MPSPCTRPCGDASARPPCPQLQQQVEELQAALSPAQRVHQMHEASAVGRLEQQVQAQQELLRATEVSQPLLVIGVCPSCGLPGVAGAAGVAEAAKVGRAPLDTVCGIFYVVCEAASAVDTC